MKWIIAAALTLSGATAFAVECGPLVQHDRLNQLESSVQEIGINLIQHHDTLQSEIDGLLRYAQTQSTINEIDRNQRDQSIVAGVLDAGERVGTALNAASMLAGIRDTMMDKRDTVIVERFLSLRISYIKRTAENQLRYVNKILTKLSRPGLAVDT